MTRAETLQAIAALPVSDAVKAHATKLVEGLPEWCPDVYDIYEQNGTGKVFLIWMRRAGIANMGGGVGLMMKDYIQLLVADNDGAPVFDVEVPMADNRRFAKDNITDRDVHELLRQLTGMVAITGGG
jgi:hypothetical protein